MEKDKVNLQLPAQWEAKGDEELKIPEAYIKELKFEIVVFGTKREFTFRCTDYYPVEDGAWTFNRALMDTSTHDSMGNVTEYRASYYPAMSLVNAAFMIIPKPVPLANPQVYLERLQWKIIVFSKREITFRCAEYKLTKDGVWTFEGCLRDTSRVPKNNVTIKLVNTPFMVLPAPEAEP